MRIGNARTNARPAAAFALTMTIACATAGCQDDGRDGPWRAEYFGNRAMAGYPHAATNHRVVDFNWGTGPPVESWVEDDFSIRWKTCAHVGEPVRVTFRLASDDGSRLYLDNDRILDNWNDRASDPARSRTVVLDSGTHRVSVDYFDATGPARILLTTYAQPHGAIEWLPPDAAGGCGGGGTGPVGH